VSAAIPRWFARFASASLAIALVTSIPVLADPARLAAGDEFPSVEADSIAGTHIALPDDRRGAPFVAIFAFSRKAGDAEAKWSNALYKTLATNIAIYAVADISSVPGLFRGLVISGIRHNASLAQSEHRDRVLLLTHSSPWPQIVPSGSDDDAVIIAVDRSGTVTYIERRPFSDTAAMEVAKIIAGRL
jgi:hypothetical protein